MHRIRQRDDRLHCRFLTMFIVPVMIVIGWELDSSSSQAQPPAAKQAVTNSQANRTDDSGHDLLVELIRLQRFEEAQWVCETQQKNSPAGSRLHARWTARFATVLAEQESKVLFSGPASTLTERISPVTLRATQPIEDLLANYPDSAARPFLEASSLETKQRILSLAIIARSVSPGGKEQLGILLRLISLLQDGSEQLRKQVNRTWIQQNAAPIPANATPASVASTEKLYAASEYRRLSQQLSVQRLSLAVLQTELLASESDDFRAAASDAAQMAQSLVDSLPPKTTARETAFQYWAEALLRAGELDQAGRLIQQHQSNHPGDNTAFWLALQVRHAIAINQLDRASTILDAFYQNQSMRISLEVDFAKLDWILLETKSNDDSALSNWMGVIEQHGGAFARRRAEAMALKQFRKQSSEQPGIEKSFVSPMLMAAQGADLLRRGKPDQAFAFFRAAALADPGHVTALKNAAAAAAVAQSMQQHEAAVQVLIDVALRHPKQVVAASVMMQAIALSTKNVTKTNVSIEQTQERLRELCQTWPTSDAALQANAWLCRMLLASEQPREAASAALELLLIGGNEKQVTPTMTLWLHYLESISDETVESELKTLTIALSELVDGKSELKPAINTESIWMLDGTDLVSVSPGEQTPAWMREVYRFRARQSDQLPVPPKELAGDKNNWPAKVHWRLIRDGIQHPERQASIGAVLSRWSGLDQIEQAQAAHWSNPNASSTSKLTKLANESTSAADRRFAMQVLAQVSQPDSKLAAVEIADQLSSKTTQGSAPWYALKLNAIQWLNEADRRDEAKRRAKYILLTRSPTDPETRKQFEALAR